MTEIKTNFINKNKKENDISKMILNNSLNNSNILPDKKTKFYHQNLLSDSLSLNSKIIENEINTNIKDNSIENIKRHQYNLSNEFLLSNSNISSLNHSFQTLSKIEQRNSSNKNNNLNNRSYINNQNPNMNSLAYHTSFNFRPSKISKNLLENNEKLNELYNYGESLTQELKISNDNNSDLLKKYINLKAELQLQENNNKELEDKIKLLRDEEKNIKNSKNELNQSIQSVQKIIDNNKLSSLKSISESEKHFNLNNEKIRELNNRNKNMKNIQKEYEIEIKKLKDILKGYKTNNLEFEKYLENIYKVEDINILNEIENLKIENSNIQKEIKQLQNINISLNQNLIFHNKNKNYSIDKMIEDIENQNNQCINEIKSIQDELNIKNEKIEQLNEEINSLNKLF